MGKLKVFDISFVNSNGVFFPGSIVEGLVTIELSEPMMMRGIHIILEGKSFAQWIVQHSGANRVFTAGEQYFYQDVLLFGVCSIQGDSTTELPMGKHTFPFRFLLPHGLPSSFEGAFGHVRYSISANIDKPGKTDHKTQCLLTVIGILDLNSEPLYSQPVSGNNQKTLGVLCCKSGPITAQFSIDRLGFVAGEAIKLHVDISNGSSRTIKKSYISMKMITTFYAQGSVRSHSLEVNRVTRPSIPAFGEDPWTGEQLMVPSLSPSSLPGCNIIDIQYYLQLNVEPSGPATDLIVTVPLILGTIPLASVVRQAPPMAPLMPPPGQDGMAAATADAASAPPQSPDFPDMPPPNYSECVPGRVNFREEGDNEHIKGNLNIASAYSYDNLGRTPDALPETTKM